MTPPEGLRHVRVVRAALHHPCTKEEYAEIVWETVEEKFVFVHNLPKFSNGVPNAFGTFQTRRWASDWNGESFAELVANAKTWAVASDAVVLFENGRPGRVMPAAMAAAADPDGEAYHDDGTREPEPRGCERPVPPPAHPKPRLVLHPEILDDIEPDLEPTRENAWTVFRALVEGSEKIERDRAWVYLCAKFGPHQDAFGPTEWAGVLDALRQIRKNDNQNNKEN